MTRWCSFIFTFAAATTLAIAPASAQGGGQAEALRGLDQVHLVLRSLDGAGETGPLAVEKFRSGVESLLSQGGIDVVEAEELTGKAGVGYLAVTVRSELAGKNRIYAIDLQVKRMAALVDDSSKPRPLGVWFASDLGLTPVGDDREIGESLNALVVRFVTARDLANPE